MTVYTRLLDALFPESCPRCSGPTERAYCPACRRDFARVERACRRCGLTEPVTACPRRGEGWCVDAVLAPFAYAAPLQGQIRALKYDGARRVGRALGLLLADCAAEAAAGVDALLAVPLHPKRLRERGYNQAAEIARAAGAPLGRPVLPAGLFRRRTGPPQAALGARARHENLRGTFAAGRGVAGLRLALVDDVMTTGATANACARSLLDAGAARVEAWAVARTPE